MTKVLCEIVRWVGDEPQPGLVEAQLVDAEGRRWSFIDKTATFSADTILRSSAFPIVAAIRCEIVGRDFAADGSEVVTVSTRRPDGVEADGISVFRVAADQVR